MGGSVITDLPPDTGPGFLCLCLVYGYACMFVHMCKITYNCFLMNTTSFL